MKSWLLFIWVALLAFTGLKAASFRPWIPEAEAEREGVTPDEYAARVAERWRRGLKDWDQEPDRIDRFLSAVDTAIYTPGSSAGLPLRVLRSFQPPPPALVEDADALRDRVLATVSGLLGLLGIEADPIRSREHILLANLLERAWSSAT